MKRKMIVAVAVLLFSGVAFAEQVNLGESVDSQKSSDDKTAESNESTQNNNAESPTFIELGEGIYFENDGGFVGVDLGYSMIVWQRDYGRYEKDTTSQYMQKSKNIFSLSYGLVIGYKQFFNEYIGVRYYARFGVNYGALKQGGFSQIDLIDYSANVDFLANVYANDTFSFGLFVGLGIGGNTLVGKYVSDTKRNLRDIVVNDTNLSSLGINIKTHTTHFDFVINAGFRLNIEANHGVELMARVPLLPKSVYNYAITLVGAKNNNDNIQEVKYSASFYNEVKLNHSIMVRYVFSF